MTFKEVADTLRLNQQTTRNWIDDGTLPALRVGRRVRVLRSDLDRLLADNYTGPSSDADNSPPVGPNRALTERKHSASPVARGQRPDRPVT